MFFEICSAVEFFNASRLSTYPWAICAYFHPPCLWIAAMSALIRQAEWPRFVERHVPCIFLRLVIAEIVRWFLASSWIYFSQLVDLALFVLVIYEETVWSTVVFRTQWFIGQYCSERGERIPLSLYISRPRRDLCRCTSFPFYSAFLWLLFMTAFHRRPVKVHGFLLSQKITGAKVRFFFLLLLLDSVLHSIIFSMPNRSRKPPFSMSVSVKIL